MSLPKHWLAGAALFVDTARLASCKLGPINVLTQQHKALLKRFVSLEPCAHHAAALDHILPHLERGDWWTDKT